MRDLIKFILVSSLLAAVFGCSANSSEKAADEARGDAAADADARVVAANARAEASGADAHVKITTTPAARAAAVKEKLTIPSGTVLTVLLIDGLGTDTNSAGDRFLASLAEPVVVDGGTLLAKG